MALHSAVELWYLCTHRLFLAKLFQISIKTPKHSGSLTLI